MSLAVALLALAMFVVGAIMLSRRLLALFRGSVVDAVVVRRDAIRSLGAKSDRPNLAGSATFIPHFSYRAADGEERIARLAMQTNQRLRSEGFKLRYPLGEKVRIRIDPKRPEIAYDRSISGDIVLSSLLVLAGGMICIVAFAVFLSP